MGATNIEWCDTVWNPVTGCTPVSAGCKNCYANRMAIRLRGRCGYPADWPFRVTFHPERLDEPLHWKKPRRVFVCSMGDLFHEDVKNEWIKMIYAQMANCARHDFMILTKRPERMAGLDSSKQFATWPLPNVQLGVSCEDQQTAEERIPWLLKCPAAVRFLSLEPLLRPIVLPKKILGCRTCGNSDVEKYPDPCSICNGQINGVIVGGETGPGARPMHPDWVRSIRDQCQSAGVPFFFKGWGEWVPWDGAGIGILPKEPRRINDHGMDITSAPELWCDESNVTDCYVYRVGKKAAGRLLDGREHNELPGIKP